mgnify:CR=1 FL=1|jgi:hypothetical protein
MRRLTIPDVRVDEHTTRRSVIDVAAVREHAMEFYCRLKAYEDTWLEPEEVTALGKLFDYALKESKTLTEQLTLLKHIRELAEADKDGRVVVLPCKVGDTVWFKTYKNNARDCIGVQPHEVTRISASIIVPGEIVDIGIPVDQIGVRVFLSETEAVAADAKPPAGNSILEV